MTEANKRIQCLPEDPGIGPGQLITASSTNVSVDPPSRYITVSTAGTVTGKLVGDTDDQAYVLPVGTHKLAFKSVTSAASIVAFFSK